MNKSVNGNPSSFFSYKNRSLNSMNYADNGTHRLLPVFCILLSIFAVSFFTVDTHAQMYPIGGNMMVQTPQPQTSYMANSSAFKQEIARLEINVVRAGQAPLPITRVPRLEKNDVLKVRMLDEQVNGIKPDQSNFDWTFLVAYINPGRNSDSEKTVSEEINFRKRGWYKEYSFTVPYDSQPIFFVYPKPQYRGKILNLIGKNQDEIRKIGEKTLEISDAYAKVGSFLNELQGLLLRNAYGNYGMYGNYNYGMYGNYNYGTGYGVNRTFNANMFMQQSVEQVAKSFNIQLPSCWSNGNTMGMNSGMGMYNNGMYNNGTYGNNEIFTSDFVNRVQCVARSVKVEDLDVSISRMLQQGGALAASQLAMKYPQIAFWINIAASALDFIIQVTKKTPLKIVPTIISTSESQGMNPNPMPANMMNPGGGSNPDSVKISLFAESQPNNSNFVTAYPLVVNKWQANSDPNIISLPIPALTDSCLHAGQNVLRSTDIMNDWMADNFTKDFKLKVSAMNGFSKEFPLKKNVGLNGWELSITKEDFEAFPKITMNLESELIGKRGFNEIRSPKFQLAMASGGEWEITPESQQAFAVGAKRLIKLRNQFGGCRCLQSVVYKPSFGGQFVFEASNPANPLMFSEDGKEVSFEVDATNFNAGAGQIELKMPGGEVKTLTVNLYSAPPNISNIKLGKNDNRATLTGERLDQIQSIVINGKRAVIERSNIIITAGGQNGFTNGNPMTAPTVTEKTFVFEDPSAKQETNNFSIELELEGNRMYQYPKLFDVSSARPALVSKQFREIEAIALGDKVKSQIDLSALPIFPIKSSKISLIVQNALTDYDFKVENITIETRIENGLTSGADLPKTALEVLDWKNMQITFQLSEQLQTLLSGKRLQFRIRDKVRGDSDWYTLGKTFARLPEKISVECSAQANENCLMKGEGIEYVGQVSVDNGKSWFPQSQGSLTVETMSNGEKFIRIPRYSNKNLLQIKLRDFPMMQGLPVQDYNFVTKSRKR